ncbi:hypothetical protein J2T38_001385 [Neisseria perflava]|uniref:DUF2868 domain-containing protein n=1 Tax=Neisseria perflava TaxID=33053 RepID=UPI00209DEE5B|nr:DUF2868 domain-containing protein [Neisseria perflava]MCP1772556.1 hypothetical protein [Neisseria perflava]
MFTPARKLAELVRILEENAYVFSADPAQVTESVRYVEGAQEQKLIRRAKMIDRNGTLCHALERVRIGSLWLWMAAAALLFASGFSGTYLLMENQGLNFFLILSGVLGMNTVMLLVWLLGTVLLRVKPGRLFSPPVTWLRSKDPINQAVVRLYAEEWRQASARWRIGAASHSLWLATLSGMLVSVLLLLLVRQYTFNWESTLLSSATTVRAVEWLAWLPAKLSFPVPDAEAVLNGRLNSNAADARQWAGLLLGSIICYGILPRLAAWLACKILLKVKRSPLPLDKPYYQAILRTWQTQIVDADDHQESIAAVAPKIAISGAPKWALMLETPWPDTAWSVHALGQEWLDKGVADSRDSVAHWENELTRQPVQLLLGVRADTVPDRGLLRQITRLAEAAQGGAVVQLLTEQNLSDGITANLQHWQQALGERNIAWLNPPKISQQMRQQTQQTV